MPRYKLLIEYDGRGLAGWQRQADLPSVQQFLEEAIARYCGEPVTVQGAGRTDAGVHALGQIVHVDLPSRRETYSVCQGINFHLATQQISVLQVTEADDDFHARFSAVGRKYLYRIINRRSPLALDQGRAWHVIDPLNVEAMQEAAAVLRGHHDFSSFRDSQCQAKSAEKTLERLDITRHGEEIRIITEARSFLHHQVRIMAGSLKLVGSGKWGAADLQGVLEARDRRASGPTAPPDGLYLTEVVY